MNPKEPISNEEAVEIMFKQNLVFTQLGMTISDYVNAMLTGRTLIEALVERAAREDLVEH